MLDLRVIEDSEFFRSTLGELFISAELYCSLDNEASSKTDSRSFLLALGTSETVLIF